MSKIAEEFFRFVDDPETKKILKLDLDELHACMEADLWKASIVLIGSLIETVLYHHINNSSIRDNIENFDKRNDVALSNLLSWAKKYDVIDEHLYRLAEPIRDYRNLIHPRVYEKLKIRMSDSLVKIGYNVFLEIVQRINESHRLLTSQETMSLIEKVVVDVCGRPATESDFVVYGPIFEKYGNSVGEKIVERSLREGIQNE